MNRSLAILLTISVVAATSLAQAPTAPASAPAPKSSLRILCGTFPIALFTRNITAGRANVQVESMIPAGMGCPHDYVLTPADMQKIAASDVFIANGLGMEEFLGEPLKKANPNIVVIDTSEGISDLIELQEPPHEAENEQQAADGHNQAESQPVRHNPHLFASPRMAAQVVRNIAAGLAKVDPAGAGLYERNAKAYAARLEKLADEFAEMGKKLQARKIVTEHAVFDYLARDAGLEIVAVVEETPGQEPSASEMLGLVRLIRNSSAAAVFTEPQYPARVAQTVAMEAGVKTAVLDPVASGPDDAAPDYYEKVMRANIQTLKTTLESKGPQ
ncbi:MAG: zinc ABC transporter substrate-binding protein [Phycisphaerae bacterium]|jgi:ABC-type Zn uptake system ZnuABC Zn-binding protein ZnuA